MEPPPTIFGAQTGHYADLYPRGDPPHINPNLPLFGGAPRTPTPPTPVPEPTTNNPLWAGDAPPEEPNWDQAPPGGFTMTIGNDDSVAGDGDGCGLCEDETTIFMNNAEEEDEEEEQPPPA